MKPKAKANASSTESAKWTIIATIMTIMSKVAGGGSTALPSTMAAIIRSGPQGLCPVIMKTAPATTPAQIAAFQSTPYAGAMRWSVVVIVSRQFDAGRKEFADPAGPLTRGRRIPGALATSRRAGASAVKTHGTFRRVCRSVSNWCGPVQALAGRERHAGPTIARMRRCGAGLALRDRTPAKEMRV